MTWEGEDELIIEKKTHLVLMQKKSNIKVFLLGSD
jgi:hypothetical protein